MKFTRLLPYITPHRGHVAAGAGIDSLAALTQPWIAGKLASAALDGGGGNDLVRIQQVLLLWLGLIMVKSILSFFASYLVGTTGEKMSARLRKRVYEHIQVLPIAYFQTRRAGESLSLLSNDAMVISNFVTTTLVSMLPLLLTFFGAFFIMTRLDIQIALVAVLLLPVYYMAMKLIGLKIRPIATDWVQAWSRMISFVEENLGLLPVIKSFGREKVETQRFDSRNKELLILSKRQILVQSILAPAISFLAATGLLLLLWLGIKQVVIHEITPGTLVSLLLYAMLMTRPISGLANVYGEVQRAARASGAHEFIIEMPDGYDTTIGDQGISLSGEQRQKLSLARTLLTDPPILILDEATAMFDPQGEEDFIDGCSELLEQRTVILITHRPVTVALANRVVKMQDARVLPGAHL